VQKEAYERGIYVCLSELSAVTCRMSKGTTVYKKKHIKETYMCAKKGLRKRYIRMPLRVESAITCRMSKGTTVYKKRPVKETYMCEKEPTCIERGLYKRDIYVCLLELSAFFYMSDFKRDNRIWKETKERDVYVCKGTNVYEKRPLQKRHICMPLRLERYYLSDDKTGHRVWK